VASQAEDEPGKHYPWECAEYHYESNRRMQARACALRNGRLQETKRLHPMRRMRSVVSKEPKKVGTTVSKKGKKRKRSTSGIVTPERSIEDALAQELRQQAGAIEQQAKANRPYGIDDLRLAPWPYPNDARVEMVGELDWSFGGDTMTLQGTSPPTQTPDVRPDADRTMAAGGTMADVVRWHVDQQRERWPLSNPSFAVESSPWRQPTRPNWTMPEMAETWQMNQHRQPMIGIPQGMDYTVAVRSIAERMAHAGPEDHKVMNDEDDMIDGEKADASDDGFTVLDEAVSLPPTGALHYTYQRGSEEYTLDLAGIPYETTPGYGMRLGALISSDGRFVQISHETFERENRVSRQVQPAETDAAWAAREGVIGDNASTEDDPVVRFPGGSLTYRDDGGVTASNETTTTSLRILHWTPNPERPDQGEWLDADGAAWTKRPVEFWDDWTGAAAIVDSDGETRAMLLRRRDDASGTFWIDADNRRWTLDDEPDLPFVARSTGTSAQAANTPFDPQVRVQAFLHFPNETEYQKFRRYVASDTMHIAYARTMQGRPFSASADDAPVIDGDVDAGGTA
jgi:hypothetical protein